MPTPSSPTALSPCTSAGPDAVMPTPSFEPVHGARPDVPRSGTESSHAPLAKRQDALAYAAPLECLARKWDLGHCACRAFQHHGRRCPHGIDLERSVPLNAEGCLLHAATLVPPPQFLSHGHPSPSLRAPPPLITDAVVRNQPARARAATNRRPVGTRLHKPTPPNPPEAGRRPLQPPRRTIYRLFCPRQRGAPPVPLSGTLARWPPYVAQMT